MRNHEKRKLFFRICPALCWDLRAWKSQFRNKTPSAYRNWALQFCFIAQLEEKKSAKAEEFALEKVVMLCNFENGDLDNRH